MEAVIFGSFQAQRLFSPTLRMTDGQAFCFVFPLELASEAPGLSSTLPLGLPYGLMRPKFPL